MYEGMIRRVAERCMEDLQQKDRVRVSHGFAAAVDVLTTVARELNKPDNWVTNTCVYQLYIHHLADKFNEKHLEQVMELSEVSQGRRNLP